MSTEYTTNWSEDMRKSVQRSLLYYRNKKCSVLEIGVFEGRSAAIFFEEILTHPESTYTGIDDWWSMAIAENKPQRDQAFDADAYKSWQETNAVYRRAMKNFEELPAGRWKIIEKPSHKALYGMHKENTKFDIVYIDGGHSFGEVLLDSILAWPLCKDVMFWDDAKPDWEVTPAIMTFLGYIHGEFNVIFSENNQFGIQRRRIENFICKS